MWTRTGWDWNRIYPGGELQAHADQRAMLRQADAAIVPVVGYHLDVWWGLKRQHQIYTEPFFESTLMVTADGGHDDLWKEAGIDHVWFPPGVSTLECTLGRYKSAMASRLAFVGSWRGYHPESAHRYELVGWLHKNYPDDCVFWPKLGEPALRGQPLRDLYRSVKVVVGDSCFSGTGLANYWSDRIPETLGRGGVLLHPDTPGLDQHFTSGIDLQTWPAGDWDQLGRLIDETLNSPILTDEIRHYGRATVLKHHTYELRIRQLVELLEERNLL